VGGGGVVVKDMARERWVRVWPPHNHSEFARADLYITGDEGGGLVG